MYIYNVDLEGKKDEGETPCLKFQNSSTKLFYFLDRLWIRVLTLGVLLS